jgi:hypothetical protein
VSGPRLLPTVLPGLVLGAVVAVLAGGGAELWRAPVLGTAAGLLLGGLRRLARLGALEWRRSDVPASAYRSAVGPLLAALLLAAVATG